MKNFAGLNTLVELIGFATIFSVSRYLSEIRWIITELETIHETDQPCLQPIYLKHFSKGYRLCKTLIKFITFLGVVAFVAYCTMGMCSSYFILQNKFPLPMFLELSLVPFINIPSYLINMAVQIIAFLTSIIFYELSGILLVSFLTICNSLLSTTAEISNSMDDLTREIGFDEWSKRLIESLNKSKRYLERDTALF